MPNENSSEITFTLGHMYLLVGGDRESVFIEINDRGGHHEEAQSVDLPLAEVEILIKALIVCKKRIENNPCKGCPEEDL
ncbi:hypothetical protein D1B31_22050 [Neobacillus notoginsengisoli]|uniref:Uncharacterized protein n=1 Tax=Neobacillus notoginsengisoli TaxID=1578198 RepID=A0A417YFG5_9BACI|nr:hypothetical protein [Neobacillus notoginsengisoli]RHW31492.1 hypothetical protein D1B31_22050 [Neobacillus notoginsengisoli]